MSDKKSRIDPYIDQFLEHLSVERGLSPLTIRNYRHWLSRFSGWMADHHPRTTVENIDGNIVRKYRVWLDRLVVRPSPNHREKPLSATTTSYHIVAFRSFLRWCARADIDTLAAEKVDVPKSRSRSLVFLTPEQLARLLSAPKTATPKGLRDRAIMEVLFSTGLRVSELVNLDRDLVDLKRQEFSVTGKGGSTRVVFLSDRAADWLKKYLAQRDDHFSPLIVRLGGKKPAISDPDDSVRLTARSIQRLLSRYRKAAGLAVRVTPHALRHTFATDLLQNGADLREVQELLGHKNVATTQIYTHVTNRRLREVHRRAHSGNRQTA